MVRNPHAWLYSLRLHVSAVGKLWSGDFVDFLEAQLRLCPALARAGADARCDATNATNDANQVYAWAAGLPPRFASVGCGGLVDFWTLPSRLLLVTERFADSLWLLATLLGLEAPRAPPRQNARGRAAYAGARVTLDSERRLADFLAETCLPDVYVAARRKFDRDLARARRYCPPQGPCDLASAALGRELWPPTRNATAA